MKHIFNLLFIILPLMLSCSQKQQGYTLDSTRTELKELIENRDSLTPGQVAKKERLVKLVMERVTVEDGKVENLSRPEDFIEQDLSGFYHDILEESVVDLNRWIEVEQISNVDSLLSEAMRYYLCSSNIAIPPLCWLPSRRRQLFDITIPVTKRRDVPQSVKTTFKYLH